MQIRTHIERAIAHVGSQTKLAAQIGCSQQQISYLLRAKAITAEMAIAIDRATDGVVSKEAMRPDIFVHPTSHANASASVQGVRE